MAAEVAPPLLHLWRSKGRSERSCRSLQKARHRGLGLDAEPAVVPGKWLAWPRAGSTAREVRSVRRAIANANHSRVASLSALEGYPPA